MRRRRAKKECKRLHRGITCGKSERPLQPKRHMSQNILLESITQKAKTAERLHHLKAIFPFFARSYRVACPPAQCFCTQLLSRKQPINLMMTFNVVTRVLSKEENGGA